MGKARDYIPALKYGHRIDPNDIAGMIGLPYVGEIFYVDATAGNDSTNAGKAQNDAFKTVATAFDACTSGQHDVIIIAPTGGTGRTSETTAITWNKRFTHLIGSAAPTPINPRAGMTFATGGSLVVSENGCIFKNLTFTSSADIDVTVSVTGNRNAFLNVDFKGTSNATSADDTKWRALNLNGAEENLFSGCTFGQDTMNRGVANASLEFEGISQRNEFHDCFFTMTADTAEDQLHVLITGGIGVGRSNTFKDCTFYAFYDLHSAKVDAVMDLSAQTNTFDFLMMGSNTCIGFDDWEKTTASGFMWFPAHSDGTDSALLGIGENNST